MDKNNTVSNTSEKTMSKRAYLKQIKNNYPLTEDEIAFIDRQIALINKKNSRKKNFILYPDAIFQ